MTQTLHSLFAQSPRQGLHEITGDVAAWLADQPVREGLLTIFIRHTSASILIQENVDPDVQRDLETFFMTLAPEDDRLYAPTAEGPDDMPAHIQGALTPPQLSVPVRADGQSVEWGKSGAVRGERGGARTQKKRKERT